MLFTWYHKLSTVGMNLSDFASNPKSIADKDLQNAPRSNDRSIPLPINRRKVAYELAKPSFALASALEPSKSSYHIDVSVEPRPIARNRIKVVNHVPLSESNLASEDDVVVNSVIELLRKKRNSPDPTTTQESVAGGYPNHSVDREIVSWKPSQKRQRKLSKKDLEEMQEPADPEDFHARGSLEDDSHCEDSLEDDSSHVSSRQSSTTGDSKVFFRSHQTNLWRERYLDLCRFQRTQGHCLVPHNWTENRALAKWVKRQRYQYKLKLDGRHSTLTEERLQALNELGFIWDSHRAIWEERLNELSSFKKVHGHCNVPSTYRENHSLSIWVQCQRRQYKLFRSGSKVSNMTASRVSKLEALGFVWDPRNKFTSAAETQQTLKKA